MKCENVQRRMVAYAEGCLRVGDELAIDIHLVQCAECQHELAALKQWESACAATLETDAPATEWLRLAEQLDLLDEYADQSHVARFTNAWGRFFRGAAVLGVATLMVLSLNLMLTEGWSRLTETTQIDSKPLGADISWSLQHNKQPDTLRWIDTFDSLKQ